MTQRSPNEVNSQVKHSKTWTINPDSEDWLSPCGYGIQGISIECPGFAAQCLVSLLFLLVSTATAR